MGRKRLFKRGGNFMKHQLRKTFTFLAFTCVACLQVQDALAAPVVQWTTGAGANGHYYLATEATGTWTEANALATNLGGYLVSITSVDEQLFINNTFLTGLTSNTAYWIGLNDTQTEGSFVWVSGEAFTYSNWGAGEPNNYSRGTCTGIGQDYVVLNWQVANGFGSTGTWNDTATNGGAPSCAADQPYRALIEFSTASGGLVQLSSDCLFDWAEENYSELFSPAGVSSQTESIYYYRYYKNTDSYVGTSFANNHVYYLGPDRNLQDVGSLSSWLITAGCAN